MTEGVSIIIPVGPGHEDLALRALASAEAQTLPCEVVVIEDTAGRGAGWARNEGVRQAHGDLLVFLDADDELAPDFVAHTLRAFAETGRYVYTDWLLYDQQAGIKGLRMATPEYHVSNLLKRGFFHAVTTLLPYPMFEAVHGFDETLPAWEDNDLYYRLAAAGLCGVRVAEPLLKYHASDGKRRLVGFEMEQKLTAEMTRRYGGIMAKSCCGRGPARPATIVQQTNVPADWIEVEYLRAGATNVNGLSTANRYGRYSQGDRFWVDPADAMAERNRPGGSWFTTLAAPDRNVEAAVNDLRAKFTGVYQR